MSAFTEGLAHELKAQGSKMQAKVLSPAATETEFAKRSFDVDDFQYEGAVYQSFIRQSKWHDLFSIYMIKRRL